MRNHFLKSSQKNLLEIYKQDVKYQHYIKEINKPTYIPPETSSDASTSTRDLTQRDREILMEIEIPASKV